MTKKLLKVKCISTYLEKIFFSLLSSYLEEHFEVMEEADNNRYGDGSDIRLVNPCPIALFSTFICKTASRKHLEEISHAHIVSFLSKLITSSSGIDDLSLGNAIETEL